MQLLIKHIESLLPEHDCVVVPGLGGFVQHELQARVSPDAQLFYPSTKEIGFNPKLKFNDGLLAQVYQESFGLSFEEANRQIQDAVHDLRKKLEAGKFVRFGKIGTLRLSDGQIVFRPDFKNAYYPDGFGITPFTFPLLNPVVQPEIQPEQETRANTASSEELVEKAGSKRRIERTPKDEFIHIRLQRIRVRQLLTGIAACLFFVLLSKPAGNSSGAQEASMIHNYLLKNNLATVSKMIPVSVQRHQHNHTGYESLEASSTAVKEDTTPGLSADSTKPNNEVHMTASTTAVDDTLYYLVISSFSRRVTAERWLNQQGKNSIFANASILDTEGWAMIYTKKYKDRHEAFNDLNKLAVSHPEFAGAWVFSSKND